MAHSALQEGTVNTDVGELHKNVKKEPPDKDVLTAKRKQTAEVVRLKDSRVK